MAINKDSNGFTFGFAFGMVVIVGAALSIAAISLQPMQKANMQQKKMMDILGSVNVEVERTAAPEKFAELNTKRIVLNSKGEVLSEKTGAIDGTDAEDAFNIDIKKEFKTFRTPADIDNRKYPLYEFETDGNTYYVVPVVGTGLWGPIWGFVCLESDLNTVYGATFDHKTETPGLGAEINQAKFQSQFEGKTIFDQDAFTSVRVIKGVTGDDDMHAVSGITGGTITSNGVSEMVERTLKVYQDYFKTIRA